MLAVGFLTLCDILSSVTGYVGVGPRLSASLSLEVLTSVALPDMDNFFR